MIGVVVTFQYEDDFDRQRVEKVAAEAAPRFEGLPGLRSKAFDVASERAVNFYVWDSEEAAKMFFNDQLVERVTDLYGVRPIVEFVEIIAFVDNRSSDATA